MKKTNELKELTFKELNEVNGGLVWIGPALYMFKVAIVAAKLGISIGEAIHHLGASTGGGSGSTSYPSGGFGSDSRIKTDIENLGTHPELGVDIYAWTYKNDDATRYVGMMAQDLLATKEYAHLVRVAETGEFKGFYEVDYAGLGIQMNTQAAWNAKGLDSLRAPMVACA